MRTNEGLSQHTVAIAHSCGFYADTLHQMADPGSIPGLSGISGDLSRQSGGRLPRPRKPGAALEPKVGSDAPSPSAETSVPDDPPSALIQALDRLRATQELRPVETELVRALRGARHYQEESRHDLPIIDDPEQDELPPDQVG